MGHRALHRRVPRIAMRLGAVVGVALLALGPLALAGAAAGPLTMDARILMQGHARTGSWAAIHVDLQNDGPEIQGELRMEGGSQGNARFAMAVRLPTGSRQTYILHAQPPAFGRNVEVDLVSGEQVIESVTVAYLVHDATQLVVGVLLGVTSVGSGTLVILSMIYLFRMSAREIVGSNIVIALNST